MCFDDRYSLLQAKEEIRRRRSEMAAQRASQEKGGEKSRGGEKQPTKADASEPDSDADYEEEVNERRQRLAR